MFAFFLNEGEKLLAIINQVLNVLENEPRTTKEDYEHMKILQAWTLEHLTEWSTVQEWYLAISQEKLI